LARLEEFGRNLATVSGWSTEAHMIPR
jgi:hypothetical protein